MLRNFLIAITVLLVSGLSSRSLAQVTVRENDTTVCLGATRTLHAFNPAGLPVGAQITVDDRWSLPITLGFPFTFYGNTYTQCLISTNGIIGFNLSNANMTSHWLDYPGSNGTGTGGPIPGNADVLNSIMTNFSDIDPSQGGAITYTYAGIAPNRKFIVTYCDVPMWGASCNSYHTSFQTILYEGTNVIEMFLREKPSCTASWGGVAIQGLQNQFGGVADVVPGRNYPSVWTATRDGRRFTPNGTNGYTIDSIPFASVAVVGNTGFTWYTLPNNVIGHDSTITVSPTRSTTYYVRQVYCSDTTIDSVRIVVGGSPQIRNVRTVNPSYCGATNGELVLQGLDADVNYTVHYSKNGVPQPDFTAGASQAGEVTIPNLPAGIYNFISVSVGSCQSGNTVGPYTLFNPPIPVDFTAALKPSCGGIDTVVFTNTTPTPGAINYSWDFGDGGTSVDRDPSHVYTTQGVYSVMVTADNALCRDSIRKNVDTRHPLIARFKVDYDTACIGQVLNFRDTSVFVVPVGTTNPNPTTYFWDFGDGTQGSGATPIHAYTQSGLYHVKMAITDFVPCTDTAYMDVYVNVTPTTTFTSNVSSLCEGQGSIFTANFSGIPPTGYEWTFSDGTVIANTNPVSHAFDASGVYSIKISTHYQFCPDTFFTDNVTIHPYPQVNLGPDTALCPGSAALSLYDHAFTNGAQYAWTTGATSQSISVTTDGTYGVTKTVDGCSVSDSITVFKKCYLDIPNVFSPNGDGTNDYFLPRQLLSRGVTAFKMTIYNRWGQVVFETQHVDGRGWDGTFNSAIQPQGVYVYVIDVSYEDGRTEHYNNNVTLIR